MLNQCPEMAPTKFEKICRQIGANKLLKVLYDCMSSERMSDERKNLTILRAMDLHNDVLTFTKGQLLPGNTGQNTPAVWHQRPGFGILKEYWSSSTSSYSQVCFSVICQLTFGQCYQFLSKSCGK